MYLTFIKLLERFIKVLAAILSFEVLQVLLCISSTAYDAENLINDNQNLGTNHVKFSMIL